MYRRGGRDIVSQVAQHQSDQEINAPLSDVLPSDFARSPHSGLLGLHVDALSAND